DHGQAEDAAFGALSDRLRVDRHVFLKGSGWARLLQGQLRRTASYSPVFHLTRGGACAPDHTTRRPKTPCCRTISRQFAHHVPVWDPGVQELLTVCGVAQPLVKPRACVCACSSTAESPRSRACSSTARTRATPIP